MKGRARRGKGFYPVSAYFIAAGFYGTLFAAAYLLRFGFGPGALLCTALLKIDRACPGSTGDLAIFKALLNPLAPQVLALVLLVAILLAINGLVVLAIIRLPDIKNTFKRVLVINGFFFGYILAKIVVAWLYHESPFASGIVFGVMSFCYLYLLYLIAQHIPAVLPSASTYAVQYGFVFDSLFVITASALFALGFDSSVNVGLSGAVFIICAFIVMMLVDVFFLSPMRRLQLAQAIVFERLESVPVPERTWRMLLSALWATYKELRSVPSDEITDRLAYRLREEEAGSELTPAMEAEIRSQMARFMTILLLLWPVLLYVIYRFVAILILRWIGA